jgi:hypothetical protein
MQTALASDVKTMKTELLKTFKLLCKILLVIACLYGIAFCLGVAPPLYMFYTLQTKLMESEIERRAAEIIAGLPVYPEAEQFYIHREDTQAFPWFLWGEGIYAPSYDVFYGLKEEVSFEELDSYMRAALKDKGWPWVYVEWLDGYNFYKEGICLFGNFGIEKAEFYAGKAAVAPYLAVYGYHIKFDLDAVIWMPVKPNWYRRVCSDRVW